METRLRQELILGIGGNKGLSLKWVLNQISTIVMKDTQLSLVLKDYGP